MAEAWLEHAAEDRTPAAVADAVGLTPVDVETALAYWAEFRAEIDSKISRHHAVQDDALAAWERRRELDAV
ncbi:MAG TPA: hypothetical protein VK887_04540 [Pseudonocardiaceae bacterium]|nr:hypothetical protein [Pseudonocardiaceae bacterium]